MDFARMLHGSQEFVWSEPVCAGDAITTDVEWKDLSERDDKQFFVFESVSRNQEGAEVARGTWTNIVRGG
jgi:acyl dehydratase